MLSGGRGPVKRFFDNIIDTTYFQLENHSGNRPDRLFELRRNEFIDSRLARLSGNGPDNLLKERFSILNFLQFPIDDGIDPLSPALEARKNVRFAISTKLEGNPPSKELCSMFNAVKLVIFVISAGMFPVNLQFWRLRRLTFVRAPIVSGIGPVKPL
ncbi:hypothetical protein HanRHA438_Chr14g0647551 [Helianthus annuus]|nr:hypothetical protein HanHA300_Chr14g0518881 [Helianthus annuus]KAJ0467939.1 hypothetical protein HanIR_Chr14g0690961 [Helianthus annuus]KAJ0485220.1 hypothetical protein HanHA89_Chr14g0565831 [Helianthus annuus]KAJ0655770.1 hypothetical protein HanLR1_Chr14g0528171 [Helianthus annuus]KAJ0853117.1 hypothetical protein HanRHA438_Chr14g0647551 [Helianthus annuus]